MATTNPSATSETRRSNSSRRNAAAAKAGRTRGRRRAAQSRSRRTTRSNGNGTASRLLSQSRSALRGAYDWAGEAGTSIGNSSLLKDRRSMRAMVSESPMLLGAVGFGLGILIGAVMPSMHLSSYGSRSDRH